MTAAGDSGDHGRDAHVHVAFDRLIPSDVREIEPIVEQVTRECRFLALSARQCALNVPVALTEALSNAILRGNRGIRDKHVRVRAVVSDNALVLEVADEGSGFDLDACTVDPTRPGNLEREDGRGLFLMRSLMDRVERYEADARNVVRLTQSLVKELGAVLAAFSEATQCGAVVWTQPSAGGPLTAEVGTPPGEAPAIMELIPAGGSSVEVHTPNGGILVASLPGPRRAWLALGPCANRVAPSSGWLKFLLPVVTHYLQASLEVEHAANELAERYEEINLLYTTSVILGRTVALEEAAKTILHEISETVGARRATILVHDPAADMLDVVAALGVSGAPPAIEVRDESSVSATVFRTRRSSIVEDGEMPCDQEQLYRRGAMLSVPIMWTGPEGSQPLGVVNLSDRRSGQPFSAGDQKLVEAIATQIGTAIQNARLVRESIDRQRLVYEMSLAHDLQMKLLPATTIVAPEAEVAARVLPAESVGGDFYHLFRLGARRTGVMIGDVSSHGYRAALIMALAMSASAIHAQTTVDAAETLSALQASLRDELESTEMFITVFYAVIDPTAGVLRYANTGHPHAFIISANGTISRLPALDPPLGMTTGRPDGASRQWRRGSDLLLLFTDGVSDARNSDGVRLGEPPVLEIVSRHRHEPTAVILEHVFDALRAHVGESPRPDDLALVIVRN